VTSIHVRETLNASLEELEKIVLKTLIAKLRQSAETEPATLAEPELFVKVILIVSFYQQSVPLTHATARPNVSQEDLEIPAYQMLTAKPSQGAVASIPAIPVDLENSALQVTNAMSLNQDAVLTAMEMQDVSQVEPECLVVQTMIVKTSQPAERATLVLLVEVEPSA